MLKVEMQIDCVANLTAAIASCNALYFFRSINRSRLSISGGWKRCLESAEAEILVFRQLMKCWAWFRLASEHEFLIYGAISASQTYI